MPIQVPKERAYYYELTSVGESLLYWLPREDLRKFVKNQNVNKSILIDYPDGVDIGVSEEALKEFKDMYNLDLGIEPTAIWDAFHTLAVQTEQPLPRTGFIKRKFLEKLAKRVEPGIVESPFLKAEWEKVTKTRQAKKRLAKKMNFHKKIRSYLKKFDIEDANLQRQIKSQAFLKTRMKKGEEPSAVFSKLQQKTKEGK